MLYNGIKGCRILECTILDVDIFSKTRVCTKLLLLKLQTKILEFGVKFRSKRKLMRAFITF